MTIPNRRHLAQATCRSNRAPPTRNPVDGCAKSRRADCRTGSIASRTAAGDPSPVMLVDLGFQFIERCARDSDATSRVEDFRATMRQMGFHGWACGAWAGVGKNRRHRFFFVDWPADWL